jgi:dihydrofolate reductase
LPEKALRKLKLQMQMSLDGMISTGPNDEQKWVTWALQEIYQDVLGLLDSSDTILIGRKLAVDYIPYWQETLTRPDDPMFGFAQRIVAATKVVFSKTLDESRWDNTVVARGELADEVNSLKQRSGKDLIVYGGSSFVSALIKEDLIDEYYFFLNPTALGKGESVFRLLDPFRRLKLIKSIAYDCGIVLLSYARA